MADMHVMATEGGRYSVVCHFAIPDTNNTAGVNWRVVALRHGGGVTELPDGDGTLGTISAAEKAQITSGAVIEVRRLFKSFGAAAQGATLDKLYASAKADWLDAQFSGEWVPVCGIHARVARRQGLAVKDRS